MPNLYSGSGQSCGGFAATDQAFLSAGAAPVCKLRRLDTGAVICSFDV
jgi:hypothetical protein